MNDKKIILTLTLNLNAEINMLKIYHPFQFSNIKRIKARSSGIRQTIVIDYKASLTTDEPYKNYLLVKTEKPVETIKVKLL